MAIIVDNDTRLVVQGLTGSEGRFHGLRNRAYGTNLVAGVTPGKGGQDVEGVPVFDTVAQAVSEAGANTAMIFVPARFAPDAIYEAVDAGIRTVICISEHIPAHEMLRVYTYIRPKGVTLIGPNCPGVLSPGKANVGIIPAEVFRHGNIGLVSRSGTLTYQIGHEVAQRGLGNSSIVGIGGDPVVGSSFIDILEKFEADPETEYVVLVGEIGGDEEEKAAAYVVGAHVEAGLLVHRRLLGAARQDDGPRRRDHLRLLRHRAGEERRARSRGHQGRHDADRGRRARRRRRVLTGSPPSGHASSGTAVSDTDTRHGLSEASRMRGHTDWRRTGVAGAVGSGVRRHACRHGRVDGRCCRQAGRAASAEAGAGAFSTVAVPPCAVAASRTIARPRPAPGFERAVAAR